MDLSPYNNWTPAQTSLLWQLSAEKKSLQEMVAYIGKPETEILEKSSELGIVFKSEYDPLQELVEGYLKELDEEILKASGA